MTDREHAGPELARELRALRVRVERLETLIDHMMKRLPGLELDADMRERPPSLHPDPLTVRELQVVRHVASGMSNLEIAAELRLSVGTVKRHISNICDKLQVNNRTRAVARARSLGLL